METLTPVQRVAVITICLALTVLIAMLLVPWVWTQIVERFPITATSTPSATFLPAFPRAAVLAQDSSTGVGILLT